MDITRTRRMAVVPNVPAPILVAVALLSPVVGIIALIQSWPLWLVALVMLAPWSPIFAWQATWTYRNYGWFALFYVLIVTQSGHVLEHVAQMVQLHFLGLPGSHARGIFGPLDIEWVHFIWNSWVILALALLVFRFRSNPWLWMALLIAGWHQAEHSYIMWTYLATGKDGTPGLLSLGGLIWGGLPLRRPDLHFVYNLIETLPMYAGFLYQSKRIGVDRTPA